MVTINDINAFLYFSYLPYSNNENNLIADIASCVNVVENKYSSIDYFSLVNEGINSFKKAVADNVTEKKDNVIPLSGGLDSRAILAELIDLGLSESITTVTFGTPGTMDYDIGSYVANKAGVRNQLINLDQTRITQEDLLSTALELDNWTYLIDSFYLRLIQKNFGKNIVYWSGFLGGELAGCHLPTIESNDWNIAIKIFINWNKRCKSMCLASQYFAVENCINQKPFIDKEIIGYDDQIDFGIRQQTCIKPLVITKGYDFRVPFFDGKWLSFIMNIPRKYRQRQLLYKELLKTAYPHMFSIKTKSNNGLPLNMTKWQKRCIKAFRKAYRAGTGILPFFNPPINKKINYIDFDSGIRERSDLRTIVYENIQDLKERDIIDWINMEDIWEKHQQKNANYSDALIILASLEIYLKAEEIKRREEGFR